jgi:hypothetical protein
MEQKTPSGILLTGNVAREYAEGQIKTARDIAEKRLATSLDVYSEILEELKETEFINESLQNSFKVLLRTLTELRSSTPVTFKNIRDLAGFQNKATLASVNLVESFETSSKKLTKQIIQNTDVISGLKNKINDLKNAEGFENIVTLLQEMLENITLTQVRLENFQKFLKENPAFGVTDYIEKFTKDIPVIGKLISSVTTPFREGIIYAFKKDTDGTLKASDAIKASFKNLKNLGIVAVITTLVTELFKVNNQITDIQQNFGVSAGKAQVLRAEISTAAASSGDLFITTEKLLASFTALSSQLGFQVTTSGQLLETYTNLEQRFGLGANEAANLTSILGLTNKNSEDLLGNTIKTINRSRDSNKLFNNTKLILKDVADASAGTVVALGKSPDLLAKAAVKARELGISLNQVEKIADSLLNFESSIEAELKAELVTGKQLNLERARFLALNNDLIGLQEELNKQNINFAEYTQMSRIGQQALAESLGMSRDEMSQMLFNQEKQLLAQKESRGELDKQTLTQFKALSAQQKFEASVEKVKNLFSSIVSVLSPFIDLIAKIADILAKITGFFQIGGDIFSAGVGRSIEARAMGGPVSSGSPYLVGEKGPELFVPGSSGQIVNNSALSNMSSPSINLQPLVERLDRLEKTLVEYRSVPVVIENRLDGDAFLRNTLRGNRRGNPAIVVPSVYTGGLT